MSVEFQPPYLQGFDTLMRDKRDEVDDRFARLWLSQNRECIDVELEVRQIEAATAMAQFFAKDVFGIDDEHGFPAMYRAYMIGYQAVEMLYPKEHNLIIDMEPYWKELTKTEDWQEKLIGDTQDYLQHRSHVDDFIRSHMHEIARAGRHKAESEAVCALQFMLADREVTKIRQIKSNPRIRYGT